MRLGVDVGGLKIEILAMGSGGEELLRQSTPTPRGSYESLLEAIAVLILHAQQELNEKASIGIAIPGTHVRETGLIKNANIIELNGQPLWSDLETRLGQNVRLANDANCFALSEASDGAAVGCAVVFGVILHTGCGGGLVVHGKVIGGHNGLTGEWGHIQLPDATAADQPALACYCGRYGCIETYLSAPGFSHDYFSATGRSRTPEQIVAAADSGEIAARGVCERLEDRLARSLAVVINIVDPDCIVLGGTMSHLHRLYDHVPRRWKEYVFGKKVQTALVPARFGDASAVRGAAWLWEAKGSTKRLDSPLR